MKRLIYNIIFCSIFMFSCTHEWLDDRAPSSFKLTNIESTSDLEKIMVGAYFVFSSSSNALHDSPDALYNLMSDDVTVLSKNPNLTSDGYKVAYKRETSNNTERFLSAVWQVAYQVAHQASIPISFIEINGAFDDEQANQMNRILGEAYFLRAYAHFDLIKFFAAPYDATTINSQGVPMLDGKSLNAEGKAASTVGEVYDFIVADLRKAIELLPETYISEVHPSAYEARTRVKKDAARALLAKVYFQMGKNTSYEGQSAWGRSLALFDQVLSNPQYDLTEDVYLNWRTTPANASDNNSPEVIWEYATTAWKNQKVVQVFMSNKSVLTGASLQERAYPVSQSFLSESDWVYPVDEDNYPLIEDKRFKQLYIQVLPSEDQTPGTYFQSLSRPYIWANMFAGYAGWASQTKSGDPDSTLIAGYGKNNSRLDANVFKVILRTGELKLLRATILTVQNGNLSGTYKNDMDDILNNRGLADSVKTSYSLDDVMREYRRETAFEGRRINYLKALRETIPGGDSMNDNPELRESDLRSDEPWNSDRLYWRFPREEEIRNTNLYN